MPVGSSSRRPKATVSGGRHALRAEAVDGDPEQATWIGDEEAIGEVPDLDCETPSSMW